MSEQTGLDIVVEQIKIALGEPLSIQATPKTQTHAIELRINAGRSCTWIYLSFGQISKFMAPSGIGIRLDTGVMQGSEVSRHFDSLLEINRDGTNT